MKEQLITFDTAKLAKEKGFELDTDKVWLFKKSLIEPISGSHPNLGTSYASDCLMYPRPTQSLLQKWLRREHLIHIEVFLDDNSPYNKYYYRVMTIGKYFVTSHDGKLNEEYEDALEKGLEEALKLIKTKYYE